MLVFEYLHNFLLNLTFHYGPLPPSLYATAMTMFRLLELELFFCHLYSVNLAILPFVYGPLRPILPIFDYTLYISVQGK